MDLPTLSYFNQSLTLARKLKFRMLKILENQGQGQQFPNSTETYT